MPERVGVLGDGRRPCQRKELETQGRKARVSSPGGGEQGSHGGGGDPSRWGQLEMGSIAGL